MNIAFPLSEISRRRRIWYTIRENMSSNHIPRIWRLIYQVDIHGTMCSRRYEGSMAVSIVHIYTPVSACADFFSADPRDDVRDLPRVLTAIVGRGASA